MLLSTVLILLCGVDDIVEEAEEPYDATKDMQVIEQAHSAEVVLLKERIKKLTYSLKSVNLSH